MNLNENKIKVSITDYGSLDVVSMPVKIYKDSYNSCDLECLVPVVNNIDNDMLKVYASSIDVRGKKVWNSNTYNLPYIKTISKNNKEYKVFSAPFPSEFCSADNDISLTFAYVALQADNTAIEILPTAELNLHFSGKGFNENGVVISDNDATAARVNLLSNIALVKVDIAKELPLSASFSLNGFKSPLYAFYSTNHNVAPLMYILPISAQKTQLKQCVVVTNDIIKDEEAPELIGYQTEFAYFDNGVCKRVNKYNISQANINKYTLLEEGMWEISNQEYINEIYETANRNSTDIEELKRLLNAGSTYVGEFPTQADLPTDVELNSFVLETANREKRMGDIVTFVQMIEEGTDIVYNIKYSDATKVWTATPIPNIESASNKNLGLIKGTKDSDNLLKADIVNGEIKDITHNNEKDVEESISSQINRNSGAIEANKGNIETNIKDIKCLQTLTQENSDKITNEIERATNSEQMISDLIVAENERAESAEASKLDKSKINEDYMKDIVFSLNGDTNVATANVKNPVTGVLQSIELSVIGAAAESKTGLMTGDMVVALNNAVSDIQSLKYVGRQVKSFPTYADAEAFDWDTLSNIKINDFFIVVADESRSDPNENGKTTKHVCVNDTSSITINSFEFQTVVYPVNIQMSTETLVGGIISVNSNGYVYVEPSGAAKLVGYDAIITAIANLSSDLSAEIQRAQEAELKNTQAIADEVMRATTIEENLQNTKADKSEIPTKTSELTNDNNFATTSQLPTKTSQLTNDSNFATTSQIPTKTSNLQNDSNFAKIIIDSEENWDSKNTVLPVAIFGYDSTNKILKIGDGSTTWKKLLCFSKIKTIESFAVADWKTIAEVSDEGTANKYFKVGDEKIIELTTGEQITLVILGFNHDNLTSGGKAGISIGMKNLLATTYNMNSSHTNNGSWRSSLMRTSTMATLLSQLPSDLQMYIKAVDKITSAGNKTTYIAISSDKLWLLSTAEVYSQSAISNSSNSDIKANAAAYKSEGDQYDYYSELIGDGDPYNINATLKKGLSNGTETVIWWWLRSPNIDDATSFRGVDYSGRISNNNAGYSTGVSFGFCI